MADSKDPFDTIHDRIKFLRTAKGYKTASEAARAFGWTVSTYLGYENGDREPSKKMAHRIAEAFGVGLNFLLIGEGLFRGESDEEFALPLIGFVSQGGEINPSEDSLPVEGHSQIYTRVPVLDGTIGVSISGNSMWPRYNDGDVLGFLRTGQALENLPEGCEVIVRLKDGRRLVRTILRTPDQGRFHLQAHNVPTTFDQHVIWASEVTSIIRASAIAWEDRSEEARARRRGRIARTAQEDFFGTLGALGVADCDDA